MLPCAVECCAGACSRASWTREAVSSMGLDRVAQRRGAHAPLQTLYVWPNSFGGAPHSLSYASASTSERCDASTRSPRLARRRKTRLCRARHPPHVPRKTFPSPSVGRYGGVATSRVGFFPLLRFSGGVGGLYGRAWRASDTCACPVQERRTAAACSRRRRGAPKVFCASPPACSDSQPCARAR